jgi:hypothetical protein
MNMIDIDIYFETEVCDKSRQRAITKLLNTGLSPLLEYYPFEYQIEFFDQQTSEVDLTFDSKTPFVSVRIQCKLKQLCNYHYFAQMMSGYFGLFASTDFVQNERFVVH